MEQYSVLMSVYFKADPLHFQCAVQSMLDQTCPPDDFVIVCDGPLTECLDEVLAHFSQSYPDVMNIVRLPENVGIGAAANIGLHYCKYDLVAKMDADDLSVITRCEKQLRMFEQNPALTVAGGYIEEFDEDPDQAFSLRVVPLTDSEIRHFARRRQPFNNMTVMYRKKAVIEVGGYRDFRRSEDYDMYLRLLQGGYVAANYDGVLVKARVNQSANSRRASWETFRGCVRSRWHAYRIGYSSLLDFLICTTGGFVIYLCPNRLQNWLYAHFLRKSATDSQTA